MTDFMGGYGLALHTTTPQLGLALAPCGDDLMAKMRSQVWDLGRDLSNVLHDHLGNFLSPQTWQDLKFLAVAIGPGGFTGSRIGVVTARTLAQQLNLPLFGVSTLAAIAFSVRETSNCQTLAIQMPARRGQLFGAIYEWDGKDLKTQLTDQLFTLETWQEVLNNLTTSYTLIPSPDQLGSTVTSVLGLANLQWKNGQSSSWENVLPFYGQNPLD